MKYPKTSNYLIYKRIAKERFEVTDYITGSVWDVSADTAYLLKKMDGKHDPYKILGNWNKEEVTDLLNELEAFGFLIKNKRFISTGIGSFMITLLTPRTRRIHRMIAKKWNALLMVLFIPVFILGIYTMINGQYDLDISTINMGAVWIVGIFSGIVLHEISHALAALSYGGHVFEAGIMLKYFLLPCAYVAIEYDSVKNRLHRAQISAAGVESNLFMSGVFLCLLPSEWFNAGTVLSIAFVNISLALINISLIEGIDGLSTLSEFLGARDLLKNSVKSIFISERRNALRRKGITGYITITACAMVLVLQILLPILLLFNVVTLADIF